MPNPKHRHTSCRRDKRRTHDKLTAPNLGACPQCRQPKLPHQVCTQCGFYRGVQVIEPREE